MSDHFTYPIEALELSDSSSGLYDYGCERKFELGKLYNHPRWRDNTNLAAAAGLAIHAAYQEYMRTGDDDWALFVLAREYPHHLCSTDGDPRSLWACISTLYAAINRIHLESFELATIRDKHGKIANAYEVGFRLRTNLTIDVGNGHRVPVNYVGWIDGILFAPRLNEYMVIDVKTTRKRDNWYTMFANQAQCLPYGFVVSHLTGQPISDFRIYYKVAYVDLHEPKVQLIEYQKTMADIQEWIAKFVMRVERIQQQIYGNMFFKNGNNCLAYGQRCVFFDDLCPMKNRHAIAEHIERFEPTANARPEPIIELDLEIAA